MAGSDDQKLNIQIEASTKTLQKQLGNMEKLVTRSMGEASQQTKSLKKELSKLYDNSGAKGYVSLLRKSAQITDRHRSATQKYKMEQESLNDMLKHGLINSKEYRAEMMRVRNEAFSGGVVAQKRAKQEAELAKKYKNGAAVLANVRTGTERYEIELRKLKGLLKVGAINQETFNRAIAKAKVLHLGAAVAATKQIGVYKRLTAQIKNMQLLHVGLGLAITGAFAAGGIKHHLDNYSSLQSQLKLIVGEHGNVNDAMAKNYGLAKRTYGGLDATVNAYARISRSTKHLNKSENERLQVVSNINKSMAIGGTTAQEAASAIQQLGQGLASDRLAGDELKSILENAPRLAEAIADGMDVSIGKLRHMGSEGELTSARVFEALYSQTAKINAEFENVAKRIDQSMVGASGAMTLTIGKMDEIYQISQTVVGGFEGLTGIIESIPEHLLAVEIAAGALAGVLSGGVVAAIWAMGAAVLASPLAPLILAAGVLGAGIVTLKAYLDGSLNSIDAMAEASNLLAEAENFAGDAGRQAAAGQAAAGEAARVAGFKAANAAAKWAILARTQAEARQIDHTRRTAKLLREGDFYMPDGSGKFRPYQEDKYNQITKGRADVQAEVDAARALQERTLSVRNRLFKSKTPTAQKIVIPTVEVATNKGAVQAVKNQVNTLTQLFDRTRTPMERHLARLKEMKQAVGALPYGDKDLLARGIADSEAQLARDLETGKGGGGGSGDAKGSASTLSANDNEATALIGKFGSEADRARVATFGYNAEVAKLNGLLATGKIDQETYNNAVGSVKGVYEQAKASASDYGKVVGTIMDGVKGTLKGVFSQIFKDGKITMKSLADMVNDMMSKIFDKLSGLAIDGLFSALGSAMGLGGGIAGAREKGGPVQQGKTYLVGERGPELFTASGSGQIIDANKTAKYTAQMRPVGSGNKIEFANQNNVQQNINVSQQPIVNMNVTINNAPPNMQVQQNGNELQIDFGEMVEDALVERIGNGDSNLPMAIASGM